MKFFSGFSEIFIKGFNMSLTVRQVANLGGVSCLPKSGKVIVPHFLPRTIIVAEDRFPRLAAEIVGQRIERLQQRLDRPVNVTIAPGNTMIGFLDYLAQRRTIDWKNVNLFSIGEFLGIDSTSSVSLTNFYLKTILSKAPGVGAFFFWRPGGSPDEYLELIEKQGGLDLAVLGIGATYGDVVFNMPGCQPEESMARVKLPARTVREKWLSIAEGKLGQDRTWYAQVLGMANILAIPNLFLLARGRGKRDIVNRALFGSLGTEVPGALLRLHPHLVAILDHLAADMPLYPTKGERKAQQIIDENDFFKLVRQRKGAVSAVKNYLEVVEPEQLTEITGKIKARPASLDQMRWLLERGILEYFERNLADILHSVNDGASQQAVHGLFLKPLYVYRFPQIRRMTKERKKIFFTYFLLNIRAAESNLGSQLRSEEALDLTVNQILASTERAIYLPAVEAIIELLIYGQKSGSKFFAVSLIPILERSRTIPRFAWRLVDVLVRAERHEVVLAQLKNKNEFFELAKQVVLNIGRQFPELAKEMLEYLNNSGLRFGYREKLVKELKRIARLAAK